MTRRVCLNVLGADGRVSVAVLPERFVDVLRTYREEYPASLGEDLPDVAIRRVDGVLFFDPIFPAPEGGER